MDRFSITSDPFDHWPPGEESVGAANDNASAHEDNASVGTQQTPSLPQILPVPPRHSSDSLMRRASVFQTFPASSLAGKAIPEQQWLARDLIPAGQPVLLSGDGGLGKSLLALQLAFAVASGGMWLGQSTARGPTLYLSAEDEVEEIHRRLSHMTDDLAKLTDLHIAPMANLDPQLMAPGQRGGGLNTTPLYDAVVARVEQIRPALVVLDSAADFFGGNEVVRSEVRDFIGKLRKLCHATGCTVLVLSHPSVSGMQSGSGLSGSTHWNNSVRARLYLTRPNERDADIDERQLEVMKNNRGPLGKRVALRWSNGAFVAVDGNCTGDVSARADALFLELLAQYTSHGRYVNAAGGPTFAPTVFARDQEARRLKVNKRMLVDAMNRLLRAERIAVLTRRVSGHDRSYLSIMGPG